MSKKLGFSEVEEIKGRFEPGISKCKIEKVYWGTNDNGKDYLGLDLVGISDNRQHTEKFFFSTPKGEQVSLQRIKSLISSLLGEDKANEDYSVEELHSLLKGKKGRWKFVGEEYQGDNGIGLRTSLAYSGFAEPLTISDEDSKLKFNEAKDIKKIPVAPSKKRGSEDVNDDIF